MKEVSPIKSVNDLKAVLAFFEKRDERMFHLVRIGVNVALRISDLLNLRFDDFQGLRRSALVIAEKKTGKSRTVRFNPKALASVSALRSQHPDHTFLFQATGNRIGRNIKPVSRQYVHTRLKEAQEACELDYEIGTHTLRKTFGYHAYRAGTDIHTLQRLFRHGSITSTLLYIGITQEVVADVYDTVSLG